jgi:hypothetical protein
MDHAVVGRCSEQKKSTESIWTDGFDKLCIVLGDEFTDLNKIMKTMVVIAVILLCGFACNKKQKESTSSKMVIPPIAVNDLPAMPITLLDGSTVSARELKGKIILVLFQPDCDHCQHEATEMQANLASFKNYTMYFVSSSPQAENEKFATDYKLKGESNIYFGTTAPENIINNFGPIQAPSVYIYSDQKLVKEFNGQVDVGVIIKYL